MSNHAAHPMNVLALCTGRPWTIGLALLLTLAACDESGPSEAFTVEVTPGTAELFSVAPGNTVALAAVAKDGSGAVQSGGSRAFTSGNTAVATVDPNGTVTAVGAGTTEITASITIGGTTESASATVTVAVAPAGATVTAPAFDFTPTTVDVQAGGTVTWSIENIHHTVDFTTAGAPDDLPELLNASASRTFPASGVFSYRCTLHPTMLGTVRVH